MTSARYCLMLTILNADHASTFLVCLFLQYIELAPACSCLDLHALLTALASYLPKALTILLANTKLFYIRL